MASTASNSASNTTARISTRSAISTLAANYSFSANATKNAAGTSGGDTFAEFLLGYSFQDTVAVAAADAKFQRNMEAAFIDDTWKVTPKLTLSLGLRYELTPPFVDQIDNLLTVYVPHIYHTAGAPKSDWPYFVRQGNCRDAFNAPPPLACPLGRSPSE